MDPRFLKWLGEALVHYSNNIQAMEKVMAFAGADKTFVSKMSELVPTLTPMPLSSEKMDDFYREWLAFFDAVPRKDHEALKGKVTALEKECDQLRGTLENLVQGMTGLKHFPETMNPWLELARKTMAAHMEWLSEFGKMGSTVPEEEKKEKS
ncbi:MAG TPA: hypothetical protein P5551_09400 [Syntrophales bacterium]|jgi:hypothetical protein|nr:hypothetical protein [Syntrophales bacterium]HRT62559.1 hypothetical protein [Syntrophales bacterium]